jgi:3-hydroxyacyl-[acyl-carrier-protein] dehydratase
VLHMNVEVTKHRADLFKFNGRAFVDGKVAAQAEFAAMVVSTH